MVDAAISRELSDYLNQLSVTQQRRVLDFARQLLPGQRTAVPGSALTRFARSIPPKNLDAITRAIQTGCEQVDVNEW
jgi:hypothetical protein